MSNASTTIFERIKAPPAAILLGWTLLALDREKQTIRVGFTAREDFLNPAGFIQGGILSAMLDDTMGPVVVGITDGELFTTTIDMNVPFIAPAKPGKLVGEGRVVQLGKTIAFLEAQLFDDGGQLLARATSSARLVKGLFNR
jgi:uncharacterized protein (TIGR00369 family)